MKKNEEKWLHVLSIKIKDTYPINPRTMELAIKLWNREITPDDLPPITVYCDPNGVHQVKDGRHRFIAVKLCGYTHIKSRVSKPKHIK